MSESLSSSNLTPDAQFTKPEVEEVPDMWKYCGAGSPGRPTEGCMLVGVVFQYNTSSGKLRKEGVWCVHACVRSQVRERICCGSGASWHGATLGLQEVSSSTKPFAEQSPAFASVFWHKPPTVDNGFI